MKLEPAKTGCRNRLGNRHLNSALPRAARLGARYGCMVPTLTTAVGKKEFGGATWEKVLLFAAAGQGRPAR